MDELISQISSIDQSDFKNDEQGRFALIKAARELQQRLEKPFETIADMIWTQPLTLSVVRIALDLGVFTNLNTEPKTVAQIAEATGADANLLRRILRLLVSKGLVGHTKDNETYVENDFSVAMRRPDGAGNGIGIYWDWCTEFEKLPEFFRIKGYNNPTDIEKAPFTTMKGGEDFWQWNREHPDAYGRFNAFLKAARVEQAPWTTFYPVDNLLKDFDGKSKKPLFVDVGGGHGELLHQVLRALPAEYENAKLVLQDLPMVIEEVRRENLLPPQVILQPHDFFKPQPAECVGAKTYFLSTIMHDWPDDKAAEILTNLKNAMTPGYSKIIIYETALPDRVAETFPVVAALDLLMMTLFSSLERTVSHWKDLIGQVGLKCVEVRLASTRVFVEAEL